MKRNHKQHVNPTQQIVNVHHRGGCHRFFSVLYKFANRNFHIQVLIRVAHDDFVVGVRQQREYADTIPDPIVGCGFGLLQIAKMPEVF